MPRTGYTNVRPTDERDRLFQQICDHLALDPEEHSGRLEAIDFALRKVVQIVGKPEPSADLLKYLAGAIKASEIEDDDTRLWAYVRELDNARKDREHKLMMLGYNQAMLEHAEFPSDEGPAVTRNRDEQARIVQQLKEDLGYE